MFCDLRWYFKISLSHGCQDASTGKGSCNLSWVPSIHMIEGKNQRIDAHKLSCDLHMHAMVIAYAHTSMPTINKCRLKI